MRRHYRLELQPILPEALNLHYLTPQEREHYFSLKIEKRRREWLAGRMAAKRLVRKTIEGMGILVLENDIPIERKTNGTPYIRMAAADSWPLSISHSGEWAAAAMPEDLKTALIGVDIEKIEARDPAWLEIAFHPSEHAEQLDAEDQTLLWTKKEAVSKLLGIGLSADLFDIRFPAGTGLLELHGKAREVWETAGCPVITFDFPPVCRGYVLSVAYATSPGGNKRPAPRERSYSLPVAPVRKVKEAIHG